MENGRNFQARSKKESFETTFQRVFAKSEILLEKRSLLISSIVIWTNKYGQTSRVSCANCNGTQEEKEKTDEESRRMEKNGKEKQKRPVK